jgi:hypothetical protein
VISSQQLLALNALVPNVPDTVDQYCLIFYKTRFKFSLPRCEIRYYAMDSYLGYLRALWRFAIDIRKLRRNYQKCIIFICHPWHIPTNYALFSLRHEEAYMLPDGLLNYSDTQVEKRRYRKMLVKVALGLFTGLPYRPYKGHLTACDQKLYNGVYTFNPKRLRTHSGNLHILQLPLFEQSPSDRKTILILEQPIELLLKNNEVEQLRQALWDYVEKGNFECVLYKPHPTEAKQEPPSELKEKIEIVTSMLPAEMLIEKKKPNEVISYFSSALINIADFYPSIHCVSVGFNRIAKKPQENYLLELFQNRNIYMIEI